MVGLFTPALAQFPGIEVLICATVEVLCVTLVTGSKGEGVSVCVDEVKGPFGTAIGVSDEDKVATAVGLGS